MRSKYLFASFLILLLVFTLTNSSLPACPTKTASLSNENKIFLLFYY